MDHIPHRPSADLRLKLYFAKIGCVISQVSRYFIITSCSGFPMMSQLSDAQLLIASLEIANHSASHRWRSFTQKYCVAVAPVYFVRGASFAVFPSSSSRVGISRSARVLYLRAYDIELHTSCGLFQKIGNSAIIVSPDSISMRVDTRL